MKIIYVRLSLFLRAFFPLIFIAVFSSVAYTSEFSAYCARGEVLVVRDLLSSGADPDELDEDGFTPLMRTVLAGVTTPLSMHSKIVELLIDEGANVDAVAEILHAESNNPIRTMSSLHWAVSKGFAFLDMTLLLLEKGADPNLLGASGRPLHIAARSENTHVSHIDLLLRWGADPRLTNQWGVEPLVEGLAVSNPSFEKISLLLDAGSDVNARFDWDEHEHLSVLMLAAMNADPDVLQLLLDRGAIKFAVNEKNLSAYDFALLAGREDNATLLR